MMKKGVFVIFYKYWLDHVRQLKKGHPHLHPPPTHKPKTNKKQKQKQKQKKKRKKPVYLESVFLVLWVCFKDLSSFKFDEILEPKKKKKNQKSHQTMRQKMGFSHIPML